MYKKGDQVIIIGNNYPIHCFRIGTKVTIKYDQENYSRNSIVCFYDGCTQYVALEDIKSCIPIISNNIKVI
jgi:hypothetical protein